MSGSFRSRSDSRSSLRSSPNLSNNSLAPPPPSLTPANDTLEACAATANFFLYAQRNIILCLQVGTLAIERRFERHREDVLWIAVDNVSDKGNGRLVVSYDTSQTTIVWDLLTGDEVARFASYEEIRVAAWMKNTNIAFGNSQGNVILFEPSTSEHISARTIFDPITALAPSSDCRTFAIGYMNGSILVATLQPSFTILHTLSSNRAPSPLNRLAWHGSSSKQKSDMLAAQTIDGDLRVWSIPKTANGDIPSIIRVLSRTENDRVSGLNWFGWSKMGRIVQYSEGLTFVWDVRTKRVTYESVPTVDGLVSIVNYGPSATLFTLGRNNTVQQYDLNPSSRPMLVQNVQHVPAKLPPSPPIADGDKIHTPRYVTAGAADVRPPSGSNLPLFFEVDGSEGEEATMSPLARIATGALDSEEDRDQLGPLSPVSSRTSTTSRSSRGGAPPRQIQQQPEPPQAQPKRDIHYGGSARPTSPGMMSNSAHSVSTATTFSMGSSTSRGGNPSRAMRDSISTRSLLSTSTSSRTSNSKSSRLRQEVLRSPEEGKNLMAMDLFPYTKARLSDIPFRPPQYDQNRRTPDDLRIQMLQVVFGWPDDIDDLIRDELSRHPPGSASSVMLSKWLGDLGADIAASMIGSESMTSSDWMLLALSSMGQDSQKKVGEAFVQRLLEKGDIHPAVSILLGLGEYDDAVEVYVSRKYYMEAVLLTCLFFPNDWQRQSYLVRKWGEIAVGEGQPELAVRCFSCTSVESSEPWFSPRAQDAVYATQQMLLGPDTPPTMASPIEPRSASSANSRLLPSQAGLKLVTSFNQASNDIRSARGDKTPMVYPGETPIDNTAMDSLRPSYRDPASAMSARTATPGGYGRRRYPSSSRTRTTERSDMTTPQTVTTRRPPQQMTAIKGVNPQDAEKASTRTRRSASTSQASQASSFLSTSEYEDRGRTGLPSPAQGVFARLREQSAQARNGSRERKPDNLYLQFDDVVVDPSLPSGVTQSSYTNISVGTASMIQDPRRGIPSPPLHTGISMQSAKIRSIDSFINGLDEANAQERQPEHRPSSRTARRAPSESRGHGGTRYIQPPKRSPSSPVSMSPDDPALMLSNYSFDDERFYGVGSPATSVAPSTRTNDPETRERARRGQETRERAARERETREYEAQEQEARKQEAREYEARQRESRERDRSRDPPRRSSSRARREQSTRREREQSTTREQPRRRQESTTREQTGRREQSTTRERAGRREREQSTSREQSRAPRREQSTDRGHTMRSGSRKPSSRQPSSEELQNDRGRGRSIARGDGSTTRSASSPAAPMSPAESAVTSRSKVGERVRERSMSRRPRSPAGSTRSRRPSPDPSVGGRRPSKPPMPRLQTNVSDPNLMSKREQAAKELEERRLSLARRPSAPPIVHPHELIPKSATDINGGFFGIPSELELIRGHTADPHVMRNMASASTQAGTSSKSVPIGLPATPRAMRHPKYIGDGEAEEAPPVPEVPANFGRPNAEKQFEQVQESGDTLGLLPMTTFQPFAAPNRSASAPPEKLSTMSYQRRGSNAHSRQNSASGDIMVVSPSGSGNGLAFSRSIDETLHEPELIIVENPPETDQGEPEPVLLPELQHLAGPPIPPPPPMPMAPRYQAGPSLQVVTSDMHYDESRQATPGGLNFQGSSRGTTPSTMEGPRLTTPEEKPAATTPGGHRRGRNSVSESVGSKFRGVRDRFRDRSASRNRNMTISPPLQQLSPYESLPQQRLGESLPQAQRRPSQPNLPQPRMPMPYETQISAAININSGNAQQPQLENPMQESRPQPTTSSSASLLPSTTFSGYRNPKEIARQIREQQMQQEYGADINRGDGAATAPPRSASMYSGRGKLSANMPPGALQPGSEDPNPINMI